MSADGTWLVNVHSPMGVQEGTLVLRTENGALTGTTTNFGEVIPISDAKADGDHLTWKVRADKPFPIVLEFAVTVTGDSMNGEVKAGMFGVAPVVGSRSAS